MKFLIGLALILLGAHAVPTAAALQQPVPFSAQAPGGKLPDGWTVTTVSGIPRATQFDLVKDGDTVALRAIADAAAASLTYKLQVDPLHRPWLRWRWKVSRVVEHGDLSSKEGDDYAARIYVFFDYDISRLPFLTRSKFALARALFGSDLPAATLCYVWDNHYPVNTSTWSAYTDRVRMIVVESGPAKLGQWIAERRDVAADFRAAFGEEPPAISGIAVAADTDNTGESVVSLFGDLVFHTVQPAGER